ncbi:MAG: hypothetical protein GDA41_05370 [Rhodospirillales bacterium]|nr:hypothetical protein [Rhodospirillales bacterium]
MDFASLEAPRLIDLEELQSGPGEVSIAVASRDVNFPDVLVVEGGDLRACRHQGA